MMAKVLPKLIHIWVTSVRDDCGSSPISSGGTGGPIPEPTGLLGGAMGPFARDPGPSEPSILLLISTLERHFWQQLLVSCQTRQLITLQLIHHWKAEASCCKMFYLHWSKFKQLYHRNAVLEIKTTLSMMKHQQDNYWASQMYNWDPKY